MCREGIVSVVSEGIIGSNHEEVTDWWVVGDLLAVDLCAVGVVALQGFADYRV